MYHAKEAAFGGRSPSGMQLIDCDEEMKELVQTITKGKCIRREVLNQLHVEGMPANDQTEINCICKYCSNCASCCGYCAAAKLASIHVKD